MNKKWLYSITAVIAMIIVVITFRFIFSKEPESSNTIQQGEKEIRQEKKRKGR